jgi:hypothetical protein
MLKKTEIMEDIMGFAKGSILFFAICKNGPENKKRPFLRMALCNCSLH